MKIDWGLCLRNWVARGPYSHGINSWSDGQLPTSDEDAPSTSPRTPLGLCADVCYLPGP